MSETTESRRAWVGLAVFWITVILAYGFGAWGVWKLWSSLVRYAAGTP